MEKSQAKGIESKGNGSMQCGLCPWCMEKSQAKGIERAFRYDQDVLCIYLKSF